MVFSPIKIKALIPFLLGFTILDGKIQAQSFEFMPGIERIFVDAQYLKFLDKDYKFSLFSRSRATAEYDQPVTDLFTGAYVNYTTKSGFGASVIGRISSFNAGIDAGLHFFKANETFMVFALPSININNELLYSWFSIMRFTPHINEKWKLYTSLELFSAFIQQGHLSSVQRIRLGIDRQGYQFGLAVNIAERGNNLKDTDTNPGIFLRKQF